MRNIKLIVWKRSILSFFYLPVSLPARQVSEMKLYSLDELLVAYHKITSYGETEVIVRRTKRVKPIRLWILVPVIERFNTFFPDKRILTHRLLGKAALGPSPPDVTFPHQPDSFPKKSSLKTFKTLLHCKQK